MLSFGGVYFPLTLFLGETLTINIDDWSVSHTSWTTITFKNETDVAHHMLKHPDQWEGDVFPVVSLLRPLI